MGSSRCLQSIRVQSRAQWPRYYETLTVRGLSEALAAYGYPRDDFVCVQACTRTFIGPDGSVPVAADVDTTLTGWDFFPLAAEPGIRSAWELSDRVPVMVTENGITVLGYQHWSALDNYEWASGFAPTFGLIGWDHETFARTPKPSAEWYGKVARANGV